MDYTVSLTLTLTPKQAAEVLAYLDDLKKLGPVASDDVDTPDVDNTPDKAPAAEFRPHGQAGDGRKRRTKAEIEIDEKISALFEKFAGEPGMPKAIPSDIDAEDILAELEAIEAKVAADAVEDPAEEETWGDMEDTDVDDGDPMDLDEFRAVCTRAVKALGGATVGKLMAPHKSATDVPEDKRRDFADRLIEKIEAA